MLTTTGPTSRWRAPAARARASSATSSSRTRSPPTRRTSASEGRGAFVGLGNTEPGTSADVFGLEQRGAVGDGDFRPSDGGGYVAYKKADYAHSLSDTDVQMYLFETFGGWCNAVKRLFYQMLVSSPSLAVLHLSTYLPTYQMKDKVRNKLSKRQHEDEASWSTRSWLSLRAQRMSVALQLAAAEEIATELTGSPRRRRTSDVHEDGGRTQTPYPIHTHGCPTGHIESRPSASLQLADGERDATRGRGGVHRQAP